jgi:hypothetical protein
LSSPKKTDGFKEMSDAMYKDAKVVASTCCCGCAPHRMDIASIQIVWTVRRLSSLHMTETSHHCTETRNRLKTENPTKGPNVDKGSGIAMISVGSMWAYAMEEKGTKSNDMRLVCVLLPFWKRIASKNNRPVPFRLPLLSRVPTKLFVSIWKEPHSRHCSEW